MTAGQKGGRPHNRGLLGRFASWVSHAMSLIHAKLQSFNKSSELHEAAMPLTIPPAAVEQLQLEWKKVLAASGSDPAGGDVVSEQEDRERVSRIAQLTEAGNLNNVTRTAAYLEVYRRNPELHWAFLAHMVSRNGGWSMTDLQGELLPHVLDLQARKNLFLFLERANALIFQDAYPQLLLYEESKRAGRSLFRLLPALHVSAFMRPVWELFIREKDPAVITVSLIINEQNYIEGRVVRNGFFQKHVLDTVAFQAQSLLQLNQVLLPFDSSSLQDDRTGGVTSGHQRDLSSALAGNLPPRLAGLVLEDFSDLQERIGVGKRLYGMLFGIPEIRQGAEQFAFRHPHTGSRSDYWPHLFSHVKKAPPSKTYTERLEGCMLRKGAPPLYSPPLRYAWKDHPIAPIERYDWFRDLSAADALSPAAAAPRDVDMTAEACVGLTKLEAAAVAATVIGSI